MIEDSKIPMPNELDNLKIENEALRKIIEAYCEDEGYIPSRIANLYKKFVEKQEPLGKEFEKVLNDNLWELYEKD